MAGSGSINVIGTDTTGSLVLFQSSIDNTGFTGTFNAHTFGILRLPSIDASQGSFGLNLSGNGLFWNDTNVALTGLVVFAVEWSDKLASSSWSKTGVTEEIFSDNGTVQTVKAVMPRGTGPGRFAHLKVWR